MADEASVAPTARLQAPCFVGPGSTVHPDAQIGPHAVVGGGSVVESAASVRDTVIWPESVIGAGAAVDGAVVGRRCRIGEHARIAPGLVLGDDSTLTPYTRFE